MTPQKEQALHKAYDNFMQLNSGKFPLESAPDLLAENIMLFGTASDEKVFLLEEYVQTLAKQREQTQDFIIQGTETPVFRKISASEDVAIIVTESVLKVVFEDNRHEILVRRTIVMEFIKEQWLVIHVHASKPANCLIIEDTWHINDWQKKNNELQQLLKEKTATLKYQNRQLEIEAALERVRSRSMSMQKSEELKEVIQLILDQLLELYFNIHSASFAVELNESNDLKLWIAAPGQQYASRLFLPYIDHSIFNRYVEAKHKGEDFYKITCSKEEKDRFFDHFFKYAPTPKERRNLVYNASGWAQSSVLMDTVALNIQNYAGIPYSEEQNNTLKRFAAVFEQTYIRFLDLQKAEAQTREAQIEVSLERVRSRSLTMHHSNELQHVVAVMYEQLTKLGFNKNEDVLSINLFDDNTGDMLSWATGTGGAVPFCLTTPKNNYTVYTNIWEARANGEDFFSQVYSREEKNAFWGYLFAQNNYAQLPQADKDSVLQGEGYAYDIAIAKHACIMYLNFHGRLTLNDDQKEILKRFLNVFEQAYTRFLDLQNAEQQAREAQIETALERVRSRSMGLQKSEELREVIQLILDQLCELNFHVDSASFTVDIHESNDIKAWLAAPGQQYASLIHIPYLDHLLFNRAFQAKKNKEDFYTLTYTNEEKNRFFDHFFKYAPVTEERRKVIYNCPGYTQSSVLMRTVALSIFNFAGITYSEEQNNTLKRFGKVFEQTYTRFLDLQKAEASAKEAIKQASLDRVRAEIASMRTTSDLERITPLIWKELSVLHVPFIRSGVFIMSEEQQQAHVYLSTPDGKAIAAFQLPFSNTEFIDGLLSHWRKNQLLVDHWDAERFITWTKSLLEASLIKKDEKYSTEKPPENLYLQFLPFAQGMLYVGNTAPLTEVDLQLVQALANAFATAYARYEDFSRLESAKQQIEVNLSELKATQSQLIQKEKMASLGELTAGIAHEIQNPLNFVNNFSEVSEELCEELAEELQAGNTSEGILIATDLKLNLQKIKRHGQRADAIVKGMLQHSRSSSGQKELTDINALAEEYLRLSYHGLRAKNKDFNANLKIDFDENIGQIELKPQEIGRVLLNLFNNAFYATQQKKAQLNGQYQPEVRVTTKLLNGKVEIKVGDNGSGIPEEAKDKIFQPFFTTKPTGEGTGLGLSLSYDIITKGHNGDLKVETEEGAGADFFILLPVKTGL